MAIYIAQTCWTCLGPLLSPYQHPGQQHASRALFVEGEYGPMFNSLDIGEWSKPDDDHVASYADDEVLEGWAPPQNLRPFRPTSYQQQQQQKEVPHNIFPAMSAPPVPHTTHKGLKADKAPTLALSKIVPPCPWSCDSSDWLSCVEEAKTKADQACAPDMQTAAAAATATSRFEEGCNNGMDDCPVLVRLQVPSQKAPLAKTAEIAETAASRSVDSMRCIEAVYGAAYRTWGPFGAPCDPEPAFMVPGRSTIWSFTA